MAKYLIQVIFKIFLGLFILYTAFRLIASILVESISGVTAHQEENLEKLRKSPIGKDITAPVLNSNPILTFGEKHPATEEYLASIKPKDNVTSKKPNSFS